MAREDENEWYAGWAEGWQCGMQGVKIYGGMGIMFVEG